jgi:hypothetical protein
MGIGLIGLVAIGGTLVLGRWPIGCRAATSWR